MKVDMAMPEVAMAAEADAAATEATAETAAMTNFNDQIVGQILRLCRRRGIDQRHGLRALDRCRKHHQPRHGEEAKQSLHSETPPIDFDGAKPAVRDRPAMMPQY
jgi:hypothetical protein